MHFLLQITYQLYLKSALIGQNILNEIQTSKTLSVWPKKHCICFTSRWMLLSVYEISS